MKRKISRLEWLEKMACHLFSNKLSVRGTMRKLLAQKIISLIINPPRQWDSIEEGMSVLYWKAPKLESSIQEAWITVFEAVFVPNQKETFTECFRCGMRDKTMSDCWTTWNERADYCRECLIKHYKTNNKK